MLALTVLAIYIMISPFAAIITIALEERLLFVYMNGIIDRLVYFLLAFLCWWFILPIDIFTILWQRKR